MGVSEGAEDMASEAGSGVAVNVEPMLSPMVDVTGTGLHPRPHSSGGLSRQEAGSHFSDGDALSTSVSSDSNPIGSPEERGGTRSEGTTRRRETNGVSTRTGKADLRLPRRGEPPKN